MVKLKNMGFYVSFFTFIFGLIIGSFLNCVIYRLEKEEKLTGRSYCPHCKYTLRWQDLIPVFSFLFLRGKCKYCAKKISWQYPLVEISTALVFLIIFNYQFFRLRQGFGGQAIFNEFSTFNFINLFFLFYIASVLIVIFVYDLKYYLIPDNVLFPAIIITFIYRILDFSYLDLIGNWKLESNLRESLLAQGNFATISNFLLAAFIASAFFLSIYLVSRGKWMGFGDCKLAILLGLILGFPNILVGLFLSFFLGAIIGVGLMIFNPSTSSGRVKKGLKSQIPFAPFLITGTFLAMFFSDRIIQLYLKYALHIF